MFKISSKYLDVVLKVSIISACLSSERDTIKSLSYQNRNKSATRGAQLVPIRTLITMEYFCEFLFFWINKSFIMHPTLKKLKGILLWVIRGSVRTSVQNLLGYSFEIAYSIPHQRIIDTYFFSLDYLSLWLCSF